MLRAYYSYEYRDDKRYLVIRCKGWGRSCEERVLFPKGITNPGNEEALNDAFWNLRDKARRRMGVNK